MLWLYFDFADWLSIATIMVALSLYQGAMDIGYSFVGLTNRWLLLKPGFWELGFQNIIRVLE